MGPTVIDEREKDPGEIHAHKASVYSMEDTCLGKFAVALHRFASLTTIPLMTIFICIEVVMRYLLNSGLTWSQEACGIMLFLLVLCCQSNCWQRDRHIRMDLLYVAMPAWFRKISDMLTIVCGGIFYGAIAIQAVKEIPYQLAVNEATDEMHLPLWILNGVIILSCGVLVLLLLSYALRVIANRREQYS